MVTSKTETPNLIMAEIQLFHCCEEEKGNSSNTEDLRKTKYIQYKTLEILNVGTWKARQYILLDMISVRASFLIFSIFFFFNPFESKQSNTPNNLLVCKFGNYFPAIICKLITVKGQR